MISMLTLNLRYQNLYDGKNSFDNRIGIIHHCLRQELPDLIGFQELNDGMLDTLRSTLPEYTFIGCGRSSSCRGEHNSIAFRTSHFLLYSADTFWLSDLPGIPGSRFPEQGTIPRICTWAVLEYLPQNVCIAHYNTHLDHENEHIRKKETAVIQKHIYGTKKKYNIPIFYQEIST